MKKSFLLLAISFMMGIAIPYAHAAPDIAPQPCDTQYWRQMSSRAWLEAEREIMQNQNLIFKADSVLEYVCFDQFVNINAWAGGNIFVHTDYFGTQILPREVGTTASAKSRSMEGALSNVVSDALDAYRGADKGIDSNFGHNFLGGRAEFMSIDDKKSDFKNPMKGNSGYTCKTMSQVWKAAKCANFIDNSFFEDSDGFFPFDIIKGYNGKTGKLDEDKDIGGYADTIGDTRNYPTKCGEFKTVSGPAGSSTPNLGAAGTWSEQITLAKNKGETLYDFQSVLGTVFKDVGDRIKPGNCGQPAIATGVIVIIDGKESHPDGVCTNPGCSYQKGSDKTKVGTCVAN